jgi:hypothetical protein
MEKDEIYFHKPRLGNNETYIKIDEVNKNDLIVLNYFKGGTVFKETWTKKYFDKLHKAKTIVKVNKISWKGLSVAEDLPKTKVKKKTSTKNSKTTKTKTKKTVKKTTTSKTKKSKGVKNEKTK